MGQFCRVLTTALVLCCVLAADARGQQLLEVDGVELRGEAQLVMSGGGTCNVLESDTRYEEKEANHGAPMDIWRLVFSVRNGSGRWLDHLIARFQIESEWPECTNWDGPAAGSFPQNIEWADSIGTIQESGQSVVAPDQTLTEARYFIVLRGEPEPRFSNWSMDFDFATVRPTADPGSPASVPTASAEQETVFWQSIVESTNPADFEAYLAQFPNGVFRALAENRLAALRTPAADPPPTAPRREAAPPDRNPTSAPGGRDIPRRRGEVFRDCDVCPEMVVIQDGVLAMGRYEVTVGEFSTFVSATGGGGPEGDCFTLADGGSWNNPSFPQTDRHPVTCVSWFDAQEYVAWLSREVGATFRLPTEAEWESAARGSQPGCYEDRTGIQGTCPIGSYGANVAGLSDMVGNVREWTEGCWEGNCARRTVGGGAFDSAAQGLRPEAHRGPEADIRIEDTGFRVVRALD